MSEPRAMASHPDGGGKPWGPWATVGFGLLSVALWIAVQGIAAVMLAGRGAQDSAAMAQGWIIARTTIIGAPVLVGASVLSARFRKGISVSAYLGLVWPRAPQVLRWSLILLGLAAASDLLTLAIGRSVVPEVMVPVYRTAGSLPIFLIGFVIAPPLAEEFLFRGFLFAGFLESRLGSRGAIALTALAWASLHVQYDLYGMATVAAGGILLGLIRWRTGSLWLCVLIHGLMNLVSMVETMFIVSTP